MKNFKRCFPLAVMLMFALGCQAAEDAARQLMSLRSQLLGLQRNFTEINVRQRNLENQVLGFSLQGEGKAFLLDDYGFNSEGQRVGAVTQNHFLDLGFALKLVPGATAEGTMRLTRKGVTTTRVLFQLDSNVKLKMGELLKSYTPLTLSEPDIANLYAPYLLKRQQEFGLPPSREDQTKKLQGVNLSFQPEESSWVDLLWAASGYENVELNIFAQTLRGMRLNLRPQAETQVGLNLVYVDDKDYTRYAGAIAGNPISNLVASGDFAVKLPRAELGGELAVSSYDDNIAQPAEPVDGVAVRVNAKVPLQRAIIDVEYLYNQPDFVSVAAYPAETLSSLIRQSFASDQLLPLGKATPNRQRLYFTGTLKFARLALLLGGGLASELEPRDDQLRPIAGNPCRYARSEAAMEADLGRLLVKSSVVYNSALRQGPQAIEMKEYIVDSELIWGLRENLALIFGLEKSVTLRSSAESSLRQLGLGLEYTFAPGLSVYSHFLTIRGKDEAANFTDNALGTELQFQF